ncbi:unnamed protein product, partial [Rotaria sordida]
MWNLGSYIRLICDGRNLTDAIRDCHTLVVLNIPGYAAGTNPWGKSSSTSSVIFQSDQSLISQRASNSADERSVSSVNIFDSLADIHEASKSVNLNEGGIHQMASSSTATILTDCVERQDFGDQKIEVIGLSTAHMAMIHMGFTAPLASALCNKWGCRSITMIGGIIAGLSVAASVYAPSIRIMWLLFGFIGGIGMGLVYLPSIVMVGYYFEKKRAIATGIVTAGTGIGSIIFGPFSRFLFDKLGWKYGLLILACILSGCTLCAAFMRPLKPIRKRRILEPMQPSDANSGSAPLATSALLSENKENGSSHSSHEYLNTFETATENRLRANSAISTKSRQSIKAEDAIRPMYQEDILYPGNVQQLPEYLAQPDLETYIQETTKVPETNKPTAMKAFWDTFIAMTNINVLNDKKMSILCL